MATPSTADESRARIALPPPPVTGGMSLARALRARRSVRDFSPRPLPPEHVSRLCWACQGVTDRKEGLRAAPSAGALFPLTVIVLDASGAYEYVPARHELRRIGPRDLRRDLQGAALEQTCVGSAPLVLVIAARPAVTARRYGEDAERYCLLEAGHAAQNALLQATAMGLGAVVVGAFEEDEVTRLLALPRGLRPVYLIPVGRPGIGVAETATRTAGV